jgi:hypothetical protein
MQLRIRKEKVMLEMQTTTARAAWHPPMVYEFDDIEIVPPAGQLELSSLHPRRKLFDKDREAKMNADRQARWREKPPLDPLKDRDIVEWSGEVLTMLIETGHLDEHETGDSKVVAKAISEMLEEAARMESWKRKW